jgi:hypothetical protein
MFGRVPDPEDILGTVRLDQGVIVENTYEVCTSVSNLLYRLVQVIGLYLR